MPTPTCELISTGIQEMFQNFLLLKQVSVIFAFIQRQLLLILCLWFLGSLPVVNRRQILNQAFKIPGNKPLSC